MKLCVWELPHRFGEVDAQLDLLEQMPSEPGDIVVLQELALTGYVSPRGDFDVSRFAEPIDGPTTQRLAAFARARGVTLCAPLVERAADGNIFNTLIVHSATHGNTRYRKRHPWYPETWATAGDDPYPLIRLGGLTLTCAICFDVHFLHDEARAALEAADWLLFPSAWVEDDIEQREALLATIARAYGVGVVNANWGPGAPRVATQGRSLILDALGHVVAETDRGRSGPQSITYDTQSALARHSFLR